MRYRPLMPAAGMLVFVVFISGLMIGVSHGLEADSATDAKIVRGEDYNLSDTNSSEEFNETYDPLPLVPDEWQPEPLEPQPADERERSKFGQEFANKSVVALMGYAGAVSEFTYYNQWWIKDWWVVPFVKLLGYGGTLLLVLYYLQKLHAVFNGGFRA